MSELVSYWPIFLSVIALVVWSIRLEGLTKQNREDLDEAKRNNEKLYATREQMAAVTGAVNGLGAQLKDVQSRAQSIESKVDALLVAGAGRRTV